MAYIRSAMSPNALQIYETDGGLQFLWNDDDPQIKYEYLGSFQDFKNLLNIYHYNRIIVEPIVFGEYTLIDGTIKDPRFVIKFKGKQYVLKIWETTLEYLIQSFEVKKK